MTILKYYDDPFEANVDREYLESEGIVAVVLNEHTSMMMPFTLGISSLRPHIVVSDEDYPRAAELLEVAALPCDKEVCPHCGSSNIGYGFRGKNLFLRVVIYLLLPLALICNFPLGRIGRQFYCNDCKQEFK